MNIRYDCAIRMGIAGPLTTVVALMAQYAPALCAASPPIARSIVVDPLNIDLSNAQIRTSVTDQAVSRIVIECMKSGQTLWPTQSSVLDQMRCYRGKSDVLGPVIATAHKKHVEVYARISCLQWGPTGTRPEESALRRHPDLAERLLRNSCTDSQSGSYASPFNSKVRIVLENTVRELATTYPALDGLVLDCRLPSTSVMGYSDSARVAYLKYAQIDPIDIDEDSDSGSVTLAHDWYEWRIAQISTLVTDLSQCYRTISPKGKVAATGRANWYRQSPSLRNRSLEDWAAWASSGAIDEVILDGSWADPASQGDYPAATEKAGALKTPIRLSIDLMLHAAGTTVDPVAELERQQGQPVRSIVMELSDPDDLLISQEFWTRTLPMIEHVLLPEPGAAQ